MLLSRQEARGRNESDLTGARSDWTNTHGTTGGLRRKRRRRRRRRRKRRDRQVNSTPACSSHHLRNWKVLLWVVVSLLPLLEGVRLGGVGPDSGQAVGRLRGVEQRQLPDTLPEVEEKEEEQEGGDPYSLWQPLYEPYVIEETEDHPGGRWAGRSPRSSGPSEATPQAAPKKKKKKKRKEKERERRKGRRRGRPPQQSSRDCRVERREMRVRDLGLGFDSDEIVLFKFCVGSCQSSRANYDLALQALLDNGSLPRRVAQRVETRPCCRPDRYEPVSFMDAHTTWRTIQSLSAASCMCIG